MQEFSIFSLVEANAALPDVIRVTEEAIAALAGIEAVWGKLPFKKYNALANMTEEDFVRAQWAGEVAALGVQPKGYFVVDFQSPDPDTLYCWSHGEDSVYHEHKIWETFIDRRRITDVDAFDAGPPAPPFSAVEDDRSEDESATDEYSA